MRWPFRFIRLSPITRKRLRRFREMKRAYWSFWILVLLYGVSLCSELICNDRPLFLRYEGKFFFPAFRYYPESAFVPGAPDTRPDYHALAQRPEFRDREQNYMIWAPVPHGPNEVIPADRVPVPSRATLRLLPRVPMAEVRVDSAFRVVLAEYGAGAFFGVADEAVPGLRLDEAFRLPPAFRAAAEARFAGESAAAANWECQRQDGTEEAVASLHLSTFRTASPQPRSLVKVTLREAVPTGTRDLRFRFDGQLDLVAGDSARWAAIPGETRELLLARLQAAREGTADPFAVRLDDGLDYEARLAWDTVSFPFRPVPGHWLGLDDSGRDVSARLLYGLRTSLTFGLILVVSSVVFGTIFGALQGYFGGLADLGGQRFTEVWGALPFFYIMILLGNVYGRSFGLLLVCYALFNWIGISYYMRAEMLRLRKLPFVEAARCLGLPSRLVIFRHILPNALIPIITFFPFLLVGAISSLAALDFLGFGLPPHAASWGELLSQAQSYRWAWWLILYPALALFVVILLGVFIGEGLRSAFDPRRYSRME